MEENILNEDAVKFNLLIKEIAAKKKEALEAFYGQYGQLIFIAAKTVVKVSDKADEVVDDVLIKIWTLAPTLKEVSNPKSWVYSVARNCARDYIKYEKNCEELSEIAAEDGRVKEFLDEDEFFNDIKKLNKTEQKILIMKFVSDMTFEQIALTMHKSISYISSKYYRALDKLKNNFE